jgi:hypothetical protein
MYNKTFLFFYFKDPNANDCSSNGAPSSPSSSLSSDIPIETGISSKSDDDGLSFKLRGTGWGKRRAVLGLSGGGELTNGSTGWGPPPATGPGGANSGWGAPPPPNPSIAAAWGSPANASNQMSSSSGNFDHTLGEYYFSLKCILILRQ